MQKNEKYNLDERKIINYLRKNASNNENQNKIRNKLLSLFFKTINNIPITETIDDYEHILKSKEFPNYFWAENKGYAAPEHLESIKSFGATKYHRVSWKTFQHD